MSSLRITLTAASELPTLHPFEGVFALWFVGSGGDNVMTANPDRISRPPGHHAMASLCGGYCFVNNVAVCAKYLQADPCTVAILDIDYHHGNGSKSRYLSLLKRFTYPCFRSKHSTPFMRTHRCFMYRFMESTIIPVWRFLLC